MNPKCIHKYLQASIKIAPEPNKHEGTRLHFSFCLKSTENLSDAEPAPPPHITPCSPLPVETLLPVSLRFHSSVGNPHAVPGRTTSPPRQGRRRVSPRKLRREGRWSCRQQDALGPGAGGGPMQAGRHTRQLTNGDTPPSLRSASGAADGKQ